MRLLRVHTLELIEFRSSQIPKYVIASHRWCTGAETTFKDVQRRRNTHTLGYRKVVSFVEYVRTHLPSIEWLWIDTCCIDDRSSQEVSEAVNSMFRWYSNAELCLAWLLDVDAVDGEEFTRSEWFTRGWTLQELLAPSIVVFLTKDWQVIGHKGRGNVTSLLDVGHSLDPTIASLTNIREDILRDYQASKGLGVNEKLQWTVGRKTTREEDMSYCLFGIFDVAIGANYGEGEDRARRRLLKEVSAERDLQDDDHRKHDLMADSSPGSFAGVRQPINKQHAQMVIQRLRDSLAFPQMRNRKAHIQVAYQDTYRWALFSTSPTDDKWDSFLTWLRAYQPRSRIYWINAKPGAGKSSLVRFLEEQLRVDEHMQPWAGREGLVRLNYYFWSPGSALQKSLRGLLQTILYQLSEALPEIAMQCSSLHRPNTAPDIGAANVDWTEVQLREAFTEFMSLTPSLVRFLFFVDGLDEIDGGNDAQDELVEFLHHLASYPNVKICLSSRQWNVFRDAFAACPQLRLAQLNARDIESFVRGQLGSQPRFRQMLIHDPDAEALVLAVIAKAGGVFLWARLVVKELLRGIRDGDSTHSLQQKLHVIPADLSRYFDQILESIETPHRREASALLQIALHEETEFATLHPLRLIDLIFIDAAGADFALTDHWHGHASLLDSTEDIVYQFDTVLRKLSSRCKGLLECFITSLYYDGSDEPCMTETPGATITTLPPTIKRWLDRRLEGVCEFEVDFMHRSLRDHLLEPRVQQFLHRYTDGPLDARNYLRNARVLQLSLVVHAELQHDLAAFFVSYLISTLSIPEFRNDGRCRRFASRIRPYIPYVRDQWILERKWYIHESLYFWDEEQSSFLTLAIDFGLTDYVYATLTPDGVVRKRGRPLLDHVLRPRFRFAQELLLDGGEHSRFSIGNQYPDPILVQRLISLGADPNENFGDVSILGWFLSFIADYSSLLARSGAASAACLSCLEIMISSGASMSVAISNLAGRRSREVQGGYPYYDVTAAPSVFSQAGPTFACNISSATDTEHEDAVIGVLESMRSIFGDRIDDLKTMAMNASET